MSKLLTIAIIIVGTLLLLNIAGFNPPVSGFAYKLVSNGTANDDGKFLDYTDTDSRISNTESYDFWFKLLAILAAVGGVGVIIGSIFNVAPTDYVVAPFVSIIGVALLVDMLWILGEFWSYGMPYNMVGVLIFVPMMAGLILSLVEWWRFGN